MLHEFTIEACAHKIECWYKWNAQKANTRNVPELLEDLEAHAEERASCLIFSGGYTSGELNYYCDEKDIEIRGWWEIVRG